MPRSVARHRAAINSAVRIRFADRALGSHNGTLFRLAGHRDPPFPKAAVGVDRFAKDLPPLT